jgi:methylated-DNA-[protein]-cysteine S-methyltransferase
MATSSYTLFDTALGCCGVAWSEHGLRALQLPEADAATTRARLLRHAPGAVEATPPPLVRKAIAGVSALLGGERVDLSQLLLDLRGIPELHARIYQIVRRIPCGNTLSYGQVAELLGDRQLARAAGQAMAHQPHASGALPPRARREQPARRFLGARRTAHQAAAADRRARLSAEPTCSPTRPDAAAMPRAIAFNVQRHICNADGIIVPAQARVV